jgi:hypothetical protein
MAALLAPRRKHLAASGGLHTRSKSVRFGAPAFARLISALWQSNPPLVTCALHAKFRRKVFDAKFQMQIPHRSTHAAPTRQRFTSRIRGPLRIS